MRLIEQAARLMIAGLLLAGCASAGRQPAPKPAPANPITEIAGILAGEHDQAAVTVIGPAWHSGADLLLVPGLAADGQGTLRPPPGAGAVAVAGLELRGLMPGPAGGYGVARISGTVEAGAAGERRIIASEGKLLRPATLGLSELLANSAVYEGQLIAVDGTLLANQSSALLVESVGPGGVPTADAQQIKLIEPAPAAPILRDGAGAAKASVRPAIRATGLWRDNRLTVFWIEQP